MMEIVRELPQAAWTEFVANHPEGNIFQTPEMMEVFGRTEGFRPELWAATRDHQILALMLPVRISLSELPVIRRWTSRAVVFGSVLADPSEEGLDALAGLLAEYRRGLRGQILYTELRNSFDLQRLQSTLQESGFLYREHQNFLIDLDRSPDAIFQDIGHRTRKNIRRALNRGYVEVDVVNDREQVEACYDVLKLTYRSAHVPLAGKDLFLAAFDILNPKKMIRISLGKVEGRVVATSVDLLYKDVIFGWYGGVNREYSAYLPSEILTWDVLRWGAENGYRTYDFGGAGDPKKEYGVRDFKAKFGGREVFFGRNICIHSPLGFELGRLAYAILRPLLYG